jgi:uncharacterized membrane protein YphA (DoxX/SURF4 family)
MSLRDRPSGIPTTPHIPVQRSASRVFAPAARHVSFGWLTKPGGAAAYGLAVLRLATGVAFGWAGFQAATAFAEDARLVSIGWGLVAAVAVGTAVTLGIAVALGVGLRMSAAAGTLLVLAFSSYAWATGWDSPFGGFPFLYPLVLVVLASTKAGEIWGAGRLWATQPFVRGRHWLI